MIQRVEARPAVQATAPALAQVPTAPSVVSIPVVTFENPGNWVVYMKSNEGNSEWDKYR